MLLDSLASADAADIAAGSKVICEATRPLADAGWEHHVDGRWIRWQARGDIAVGVHFDAFAASPHSGLPAWTFWGGDGTARWALHFSPHAAASVLQDVAFDVAHGIAQRAGSAPPRRLDSLNCTDGQTKPTPGTGMPRSR
ncbi:hypothetical protein ACIRL3_25225 [Streptomyces sp. NPDC102384]|uniref:hypothetical protein n=1 Tax=Streptomyces sp. NPDC102384 TaxID=3366166 RepID=UPI00380988C7